MVDSHVKHGAPAPPKSKVPGKHDHIWQELDEKLPWHKTDEQLEKRKKLFPQFDTDGTGFLSLAKLDKGIIDVLNLPELFGLEPVEIRAYNAAIKMEKKNYAHSHDFVTRGTFRYFLKYLRMYYEFWVAFESLDTDGDHRLSKTEFMSGKD